MSPWSHRTLRTLAEVVLPSPAGGAPQIPLEEVVRFVDGYVFYFPRLLKTLFPVGLLLLELGALVMVPSLVPFSMMNDAQRRRCYIDKWIHSPFMLFRELIKGVKGLVLLAYYSDPSVMAHLGYAPEEFAKEAAAQRLRRYGHELR